MKNETILRNHNNTDNQMIYMNIVPINLDQKIKYKLKSLKKCHIFIKKMQYYGAKIAYFCSKN